MPSHEQSHSPESISQQFIDYVTSHCDYPPTTPLRGAFGEGTWKIHIPLPLMRDEISDIQFLDYGVADQSGRPTGNRGFSIDIRTRNDTYTLFAHEPSDATILFKYHTADSRMGEQPIEADEIAALLTELETYEAAGEMTKIESALDNLK